MITIQHVQDEDMKPYGNVASVTFEIDDGESTIDDLLQAFDYFIKSIGYHPEGCLEYVEEEECDIEYTPTVMNGGFAPTIGVY